MSTSLRWSPSKALSARPLTYEIAPAQAITIRSLQQSDATALDTFIGEGLSPSSRLRFGAHRPDQPSAEVCRNIGNDDTIRIVATIGEKIVGYLILQGSIPEKEVARYVSYGRADAVADGTVRLAPAVADEMHGRGIGKSLVHYAVTIADQLGIKHIVLWGGTHDDNSKGRALYERTGFRYAGTFDTQNPLLNPHGPVLNHDMVLNVADTVKANPSLAKAAISSLPGTGLAV